MRASYGAALAVTALFAGLTLRVVVGAEDSPATGDESVNPTEEVIVVGKARKSIRLRIQRLEDEAYARFNEINSTDLYDIHCYWRVPIDTHIRKRVCLSNAWRTYDADQGEAIVRGLQSGVPGGGGYTAQAEGFAANQIATEKLVQAEMAKLARSDPELAATMVRLGQAYQAEAALTGSPPVWTLYQEVDAGDAELPGGAQHRYDVQIGDVAWSHPLASRSFTIAGVQGRIRNMRLNCEGGDQKLEYVDDVDWNVPEDWGECTLDVKAKRGTTFALFEFE